VRVLIAGGGTGGHLFPGIALAEELTTRHHKNDVVFVGTNRGLEAKVVPSAGFKLEIIHVMGLKGMGLLRKVKGLWALPAALFQSMRILRRYKPDVVVGVGGYSSGPVVLAAWMFGIPTAVQEQNTRPGITNRILGRVVDVVFIAFEEARQSFPGNKVQLVGNPIRRKLMDNYLRSTQAHERFRVLVFGGSLGAKSINQRMLQALDDLGDLKEELQFLHQTGKNDRELVAEGYRSKGFHADVVEFIDDMSTAYAQSELVISRAGAMTLAELTVCKKASILIPFPHATDNHQELNALAMVKGGAALMFRESELTGKQLAETLRDLKAHPAKLKKMEKMAGLMGRPEAAKELADVCVQLMVDKWGAQGRGGRTEETVKAKES